MTRAWLAVLALAAAGCAKPRAIEEPSDDASADDASADDASAGGSGGAGGAGGATIVTDALDDRGVFSSAYTCAGADYSPALVFAGLPAAASYAVLLVDDTNDLVHWALWDVPASVTAIPSAVSPSPSPPELAPAKQTKSYDGSTWGYLGPCPGGATHTYTFTLAAIDVATLPDLTPSSARDDVRAAVLAHAIGAATLTGTSAAKK